MKLLEEKIFSDLSKNPKISITSKYPLVPLLWTTLNNSLSSNNRTT